MRDNERIDALRQELSEMSRRSFYRHLVGGSGGNISVRVPEAEQVLVTPSGVSLAEVRPEANVLCAMDGTVLSSPLGYKPSKESYFHLRIYRMRPEVGAVVHVHPPYATAYANQCAPLPLATVSAQVRLKEVPWIDSALPGSQELREMVCAAVEAHPGVSALLMREHGIVALGADLTSAYYTADLVEDTAKIAYVAATIARRE